MTYLAIFLASVIVALLIGAVLVIFALLRRLDVANRAVLDQAQATLAMANDQAKASPRMVDKMLDTLATSTERIHATIESTVKTVLTPPPMVIADTPLTEYHMPTMNEGKEPKPWDHTDSYLPNMDPAPHADMGYEFENEPGYDDENPFGIPGLKSVV